MFCPRLEVWPLMTDTGGTWGNEAQETLVIRTSETKPNWHYLQLIWSPQLHNCGVKCQGPAGKAEYANCYMNTRHVWLIRWLCALLPFLTYGQVTWPTSRMHSVMLPKLLTSLTCCWTKERYTILVGHVKHNNPCLSLFKTWHTNCTANISMQSSFTYPQYLGDIV